MKFYAINANNALTPLDVNTIIASLENGETLEFCNDGAPEGAGPALSVWGGRRPRPDWNDSERKLTRQLCLKLIAANNIVLWPAARNSNEITGTDTPARFYGTTESGGALIDIHVSSILIEFDNGMTLELTLNPGIRSLLPSLSIWGGRRPLSAWTIEDRKLACPLSLTSLAGNNCIIWPQAPAK